MWLVLNEIRRHTAFHGWQRFPVGWKLRSTSPLLPRRTLRMSSRIDCGATVQFGQLVLAVSRVNHELPRNDFVGVFTVLLI